MKRTRIKICGVRDVATASAVVDAGADAVGLVFVPGSPRVVTTDQARAVVGALGPFVEPVGLFLDASVDHVRRTADAVGLRVVQLHGRETPAMVSQLAPLRVVKAVAFDPDNITGRVKPWFGACHPLMALLFDVPVIDRGHIAPGGGTGRALDWDQLATIKQSGGLDGLPPLVLAGGLTPQNVAHAIARVSPYAVDVSSGVEAGRGIKDNVLIHAFCRAVRAADGP